MKRICFVALLVAGIATSCTTKEEVPEKVTVVNVSHSFLQWNENTRELYPLSGNFNPKTAERIKKHYGPFMEENPKFNPDGLKIWLTYSNQYGLSDTASTLRSFISPEFTMKLKELNGHPGNEHIEIFSYYSAKSSVRGIHLVYVELSNGSYFFEEHDDTRFDAECDTKSGTVLSTLIYIRNQKIWED
jgi:hypothetical protein